MPVKILLSFIIALCLVSQSPAKDFKDTDATHIEYPEWFNDSPFYDLADGLNEAVSNGKSGLMVLFTTAGCSYCSAFIEKSLGNPEIAKIVQNNFESIGMEIFDDVGMVSPVGESHSIKNFAKQEGVEYSPTLLFFGKDGSRMLRVIGYQSPERFRVILDYVIGKHYQEQSLRDYFLGRKKHAPASPTYASLKTDPMFINPPYALDRSHLIASKPLLVIFEKTGCAECEDFHKDVLALEEIRTLLGKFEIARFDVSDNKTIILSPSGKKLTPAAWFDQKNFTRVPALMFFDEKGNNVLETDALVRQQRMTNSVNFVLERAYEKNWTYQRFARSKGIERNLKKADEKNK